MLLSFTAKITNHPLKKAKNIGAIIAACMFFNTPTASADNLSFFQDKAEIPSLQASNTSPVNDNRIAAFFSVSSVTGQEKRTCTASNLSNHLWLIARHCSPKTGDLLRQFDGEKSTVEQVYFMAETDDLALMKVGEGIEAKAFDLPTLPIEKGNSLTLIGYGGTHEYSSIAKLRVRDLVESYPPEIGIPYRNLIVAETLTPSRTCSGDSGSPAYSDNVIYAIHTAGGSNEACTDGEGSLAWLSALTPARVAWIESFLREDRTTFRDSPSLSSKTSLYLSS